MFGGYDCAPKDYETVWHPLFEILQSFTEDLLTGLLGPCQEIRSPIFFVRPELARAVRKVSVSYF